MSPHNYSSMPNVTNLLPKSCLCAEFNDSSSNCFDENCETLSDTVYDLDGLEEVFTDHMMMDKRLRKTLYAGGFNGLDIPDHPPIALTGLALELFSKAVPNYGLDILDMDYVSAASEAAKISPCAMIIAMIYLERLQLKNADYLETVSPPGLFVVTMLVASKFLFEDEEDIVTNQMWAEVLNFDVKDLNSLERDFLSAIDWKVFVDSHEYFRFLQDIEKEIAVKQSLLQKCSTYSDIYVILQDPQFHILWKAFLRKIIKTTVLWTLGYVTTALALYSAGLILHKLKVEKPQSQTFVIRNTTLELTESHTSSEPFYSVNQLPSGVHFMDSAYSHPSLVLEITNESDKPDNAIIRNKYSYCSIASKRKESFYRLKITKAVSRHTVGILSVDNVLSKAVLNNKTYNKLLQSKIKQEWCIPVPIRTF